MNERGIIDLDTGEIKQEIHDGDSVRIIRKSSKDSYKEFKERSKGRNFTKIDVNESRLLLEELSPNERSLLFILQLYVSYESCLIKYPNGKDISFSDIVDISKWSRNTTKEALDLLIKKNIIYKGKNGHNVQYYMNPWVISKGSLVNETLFEMFKNYKIRSKGNKTWEELNKGREIKPKS